jgi:hypothetical protein
MALSEVFLRVSMVKALLRDERGCSKMEKQVAVSMEKRGAAAGNPSGGAIGSLVARVFGCWHRDMSRPFSEQGQTYKTCLSCGARRQFNLRRWEMQGDFYYRLPTSTYFRPLNGLATR